MFGTVLFLFLDAQHNKPIDYKQLLQDETSKNKITVNLPTIVRENSAIHKYSPFTFSDKDIQASVRATINEVSHKLFSTKFI